MKPHLRYKATAPPPPTLPRMLSLAGAGARAEAHQMANWWVSRRWETRFAERLSSVPSLYLPPSTPCPSSNRPRLLRLELHRRRPHLCQAPKALRLLLLLLLLLLPQAKLGVHRYVLQCALLRFVLLCVLLWYVLLCMLVQCVLV